MFENIKVISMESAFQGDPNYDIWELKMPWVYYKGKMSRYGYYISVSAFSNTVFTHCKQDYYFPTDVLSDCLELEFAKDKEFAINKMRHDYIVEEAANIGDLSDLAINCDYRGFDNDPDDPPIDDQSILRQGCMMYAREWGNDV